MQIANWIKAALLSIVLAGAVMSWGTGWVTSVYAASGNYSSYSMDVEKRAVSKSDKGVIPEDAIRLRILANSDSDEDQAVKGLVRDRVVEMMNGWLQADDATRPQSAEEAREFIGLHLDELQEAANTLLDEAGMGYKAIAELKVVPFPAKLYGGQAYPAGDYEALRITLGSGEGQNWWCVLFPPLCFVDGSQGTATASADETTVKDGGTNKDSNQEEEREVRFFLWDLLVSIGEWIAGIWNAIFG